MNKSRLLGSLVALVAVLLVWAIAFSSEDPLFLAPFRESQTAISADYLVREPSSLLEYQMPVLGAPWRVPLEFPLHQWISANLSKTGIPVAQAGRLVSVVGGIGSVIVMVGILRRLGLAGNWSLTAGCLLLASPSISLYSTAHQIETLALFLALSHVYCCLEFLRTDRAAFAIPALFFGVLAALVKITTWMPAGFLLGLWILGELRALGWRLGVRRLLLPVVVVFLPFVAGVAWSKWCSSIRAGNVMSEAVMNPREVNQWMFGTLALRFSVANWIMLIFKHGLLLFGPLFLLVPYILRRSGNLLKFIRSPQQQPMLLLISAYVLHAVVFLWLHLRHDYYLCGSGTYLVGALILALSRDDEFAGRIRGWWIPGLAVSMGFASLGYLTFKRNYHDYAVEQAILAARSIPGDGALMTFGMDWSPRLPFGAGRKALMVAEQPRALNSVKRALEANASTKFAGIMVCGTEFETPARETATILGFDFQRKVRFWPNAYLLLPPSSNIAGISTAVSHPIFSELEKRVSRKHSLRNGIVYKRASLHSGDGGMIEIVFKRDSDAFFITSNGLSLARVRGYFDDR